MRLKQRIIGIVVLVILMIIVIPLLFTGSRKTVHEPELSTAIPTPPPAPMVSDNQVQAQSNATPSAASSVEQPAAEAPNQIQQPAANNPTSTSNANNQIADQNMPSADDQGLAPESHNRVVSSSPVRRAVVAKKTKPMHRHVRAVALHHVMHPMLKPKLQMRAMHVVWRIQLASFANGVAANKMVRNLKSSGYGAYVQTAKVNGKTIHRVYVGRAMTRSKANKLAGTLQRDMHLKGLIVSH